MYIVPNKYTINNVKLKKLLDNYDISIKHIANEFILKTQYI